MAPLPERFAEWLAAAEARYLANLTRAELGRALRALSSCYVERRGRLAEGAALATAGKRAAFALFYGPLHYLVVHAIAGRLQPADDAPPRGAIVDLGCGTGAAGAAWAGVHGGRVAGFDVNPWAVREAAWTYHALRIDGSASRAPAARVRLTPPPRTVLAAYLVNELPAGERAPLRERLLAAAAAGSPVLVVEPIARGVTPWWSEWRRAFESAGGRADEWRFPVDLPSLLRDLDRSAGLDHRELTARTLSLRLNES
ncbi:MAG TPA: hypothetical protein VF198_16895 [Vicinamibacterales bacterium]